MANNAGLPPQHGREADHDDEKRGKGRYVDQPHEQTVGSFARRSRACRGGSGDSHRSKPDRSARAVGPRATKSRRLAIAANSRQPIRRTTGHVGYLKTASTVIAARSHFNRHGPERIKTQLHHPCRHRCQPRRGIAKPVVLYGSFRDAIYYSRLWHSNRGGDPLGRVIGSDAGRPLIPTRWRGGSA